MPKLDAESALGFAKLGIESAGSLIGGVVDIFQGAKLKNDATAELSGANAELRRLKDSQPNLSTPSAYYEGVKNAYDQRLLTMRSDDINRSLATTVQSAQQYGARGLGATMQATSQAQQQLEAEGMKQQQLQTSALSELAGAQERSMQLKERRSDRDIEYGYDAKKVAEARLAAGLAQKSAGITGALTGAASLVGGGFAAGLFGGGDGKKAKPKATPKTFPDIYQDDRGVTIGK